MSISPDTIEKIRLSVNIVDIVREHVPSLKKSGRNWKANCPFHHERTPSFMVSPEKGIFHCFGCMAGGDVFKFLMLIDNLTWPESVRKLADRAGITIEETREETLVRSERQKLYDLLEQTAAFYHRSLLKSDEAAPARSYLKERGVSTESLEKFLIGFAPKGALLASSSRKGVTPEQFVAAGVMTRTERGRLYEYMSDRVVFPIHDTQGRVVAFGGRTLKDEQPKYLNTPETAVYSKSHHLYGLFQSLPAVRAAHSLVLLEGYMDVVVTHQYGVGNTVATLGTALTGQHAKIVGRYADDLTLLFDADPAGYNATRRAIETLAETDISVKVSLLPDGMDPDEYILQKGKDGFLSFLEKESIAAVAFLTDRAISVHGTGTPEAKAKAAAEIIPVVDRIKNGVLRAEWLRFLAGRLQITDEGLRSELRRVAAAGAGRGIQPTPAPGPAARTSAVRSVEEELLQLLAAYPQFTARVGDDIFAEGRCKALFRLLKDSVPAADIAGRFEGPDGGWVTELLLEEKTWQNPDRMFETLVRDARVREMEKQRQQLQKEIVLMSSGALEMDEEKYQRFYELTRQLKGSVSK